MGRLPDEAVLFLPLAHHEHGHVDLWIARLDAFQQMGIDGVAGDGQSSLVLFGWIAALHHAEVSGSGADVDDQCVQQGVEAVGDGKRLADDHQAVHDALHGVAQVLLVGSQRGGWYADHCAHVAAVDLAAIADSDQAEQVLEQLAHRLNIFLRALLEQSALEGAMEVEHGAVADGFVADQHLALEHFARDHVGGPADEAVDDETLAVRSGNRTPRRAEVNSDMEDLGGCHVLRFLSSAVHHWRLHMRGCRGRAPGQSAAGRWRFRASPLRGHWTDIRPRRGLPACRLRRVR